jgi:cation:H+ antiporter
MALYAADRLVHHLSILGKVLGMSAGLLGLLVALGADGPEITSALVALFQNKSGIGVGVIVGSNIYNIAGLLGLAALVAGQIPTGAYRLTLEGSANLLLTVLMIALLLFPGGRIAWALCLLLGLAAYTLVAAVGGHGLSHFFRRPGRPAEHTAGRTVHQISGSTRRGLAIAATFTLFIVLGSALLVNESIFLGPKLGIPSSFIGTFVLPVATSLPNSWAALQLARRHLPAAAIASTFNSNSINAAIGTGVPSLFLTVHASHAVRILDVWWLLGMTVVALFALATRWTMARLEGGLLIGLYAGFVALRLAAF